MKILAIHAHPDDVEFLAAGTLYLLQDKGHEIVIATMSLGDKGSPDRSREEITAIRQEEARRSAAVIGAEYACLGLADFEIFDDDATRRRVTEFVRRCRPHVILAASLNDYLVDHEAAGMLARHAAFFAGVRLYETGQKSVEIVSAPPLDYIPAVYYMDPIEGVDIYGHPVQPDFCIDITNAMAVKEKMLACHASQREWLKKHHGVDLYLDAMREWSSKRGREFGCQYGEGFRQHKGHAYPQDNLLKKLLPSSVFRI